MTEITAAARRRLLDYPDAFHVIYDPNSLRAYWCDSRRHDPERPHWCPSISEDGAYRGFLVARHEPPVATTHSHWRST